MKKLGIYLFWIAILGGMILKISALNFNGMHDMATYYDWGMNMLNQGLHSAYHGTYFPIQYQLFEFTVWLSNKLGIEYVTSFKMMNLLFDTGILIVMYLLLRRMGLSFYYVLLYWLHPWFLNVFSLGYVDFQFSFFVLLSLYFSLKPSINQYLLSSLFLGIAFLMKPQTEIILLSFGIYALINFLKFRDLKPLLLFVFPITFYLVYLLYFTIYSSGPQRIIDTYIFISRVMPCLNANFLNGWFITAYLLKSIDEPIYSVSDQLTILTIQVKVYAIIFVLGIITTYVLVLTSNKENQKGKHLNPFLITLFSSMVVPFLMTSAHENHLFLATVLIIPTFGLIKNSLVRLNLHIILILQFLNLHGYYGAGDIIWRLRFFSYEVAFYLSFIACICFCIFLIYMLNPRSSMIKNINLEP